MRLISHRSKGGKADRRNVVEKQKENEKIESAESEGGELKSRMRLVHFDETSKSGP